MATFSARTGWDRRPNALWLRREALIASGAQLIDLTETNPTRCGFEYPVREMAEALGSAAGAEYAPHPKGLASAREAVARGWVGRGAAAAEIEPESVVLTAGTSEGYGYLFKLLCEPGDAAVVFTPGYPLLDYLAELESVRLLKLPLLPAADWELPLEALRRLTPEERVKLVAVVSPSNPTGQFLRRAEWGALIELCAERGWALAVDEVFAGYGWGSDAERVGTAAGRESPALTFAMSGLSKLGGMPQLKVAWMAVGGPAGLREEALARLELIADAYLSVNGPVQRALPRLLELAGGVREQIRARVAANRQTLQRASASGAAFSVLPSEGGWSAVLRVSRSEDEEAQCLRLLEAGVVVQPGYFFDFAQPGYCVVSLLPPLEQFKEGVEILARATPALSAIGR